MATNGISANQALHYVESLRLGIPPDENISFFTVGRQAEINALYKLLDIPSRKIKLLRANYGSGKTHLLKLLREEGLRRNFAVSLLTLDAKSGIRFNKLDEIFGAICRNLVLPDGSSGIAGLFDAVKNSPTNEAQLIQKYRFYNGNRRSPPLQEAMNWWLKYDTHLAKDMIIEWMNNPYHFVTTSSQQELYFRVLNKPFISSSEKEQLAILRHDGTFKWFDGSDYSRTWAAFNELQKLTQIGGMNGLILLIDEFEDVISNMTKAQQIRAFYHLFGFYSGKYLGLAVFAVTPDFVSKCRDVILRKSILDFPIRDFEQLPSLAFPPLGERELHEFCHRIMDLYEHAYQFKFPKRAALLQALSDLSIQTSRSTFLDQPRYIAKQTTKMLDAYLED